VDGQNPTGSFKDRGMTVAVTRAVSEGAEAIICASTGNTSASAAAYAARAGIRAYVVVPQGKIALGKLSQAVMHGAKVIQIDGNFDQALTLVRDVKERFPTQLALVNSVNPDRVEGQKTAAFEICDALGRAPDYHLLPVGNAGNITAYWKGYCEYHKAGIIDRRPHMMGFEAAGAAPWCSAASSRIRRRWPPPSASATLRAGMAPSRRARRVRRHDRCDRRRRDRRGLPAARAHRGRVRRAGIGDQRGGRAQARRQRPAPAR
jgi:threonine synthase